MTDERVQRAFREHPDFEEADDGRFETPEKPFPGVVSVTDAEDDGEGTSDAYSVEVRTPMLDAVVEGEEVAEVVEDGWFETLELRLEDAHTVTNADAAPPDVEREGDEVVVTVEFASSDPEQAVEDALAVVEYVEGTWVQGIIPGYDYREPAAGLRERARQNYDEDGSGGPGGSDGPAESGGAPL
ncbi:DUF5813 family protein [Halorussus limi]|uniref:DUF5813 family protein n=1 Tax=Halorussus limi TaxID=2938695 RepID=A0A8U0HWG4_9EURY|nr:DUF5813 family protein [Halorussus limi]UPV74934.1 DUF5813 family protein [Halorussus limi]